MLAGLSSRALPLLLVSPALGHTLHVPSVEYPTIQAAINAAGTGDEIIVAAGTYNEKINFLGKAITLRSADGPEVTTIDGTGLDDSVVKCVSGEGPDALFRGFTVTGGTGEATPFNLTVGGGMLIRDSSLRVLDCRFLQNRVSGDGGEGGAIFNESGNLWIANCQFAENETDGSGVIVEGDASSTITDCLFAGNAGPAIGSWYSSTTVLNSVFDDHSFGIRSRFGALNVANCLFLNSFVALESMSADAITVTNCTFTRNSYGLIGLGEGIPVVSNCVFWGNAPSGEDPIEESQISGSADVTYSLIQGLDAFASGVGNIDADPMFVVPDGGDFRVRPGSPCIDAASTPAFFSAVHTVGLTVDLDGHTRLADTPATSDTGVGLGAVIDMGAYEFGSNPGDLDHDGDMDLADFAVFLDDFTGP